LCARTLSGIARGLGIQPLKTGICETTTSHDVITGKMSSPRF
jgi:hypothetical protein